MRHMGVAFVLLFVVGCSKPNTELDPKQYIVVLNKNMNVEARHNVLPARKVFSTALKGGVYHLEDEQLLALANDPDVAYIEKDQIIRINATQINPEWGLDRIDQAQLPLDKKYEHDDGGSQVNAYVIDTGVLNSHQQFGGRAFSGADLVDNDTDATDCQGHGTHVAGTIGSALYGVIKNVKIFGVRVLDCSGSGTMSDVIAGVDWVTANHKKPAVANMSLGGSASKALDDAVKASVQAGVTYIVAAGNENADACSGSPSSVPEAITVGATTISDSRASFSNFGKCIDLFAPGEDIKSLGISNVTATDTMSGTSMAAPHVAGIAALYLSRHPTASPAEVTAAILNGAISGKVLNPGSLSPNRLANARLLGGGGGGGGGPGEQPEIPKDPELANGNPILGLAGAKNEQKNFVIQVPAGARNLTVTMSGGTGDADLYLKSVSPPTLTSYSCRPYRTGNNETCTFRYPRAGLWYVMLRGYANFSGVKLVASY